MMIAAAQGSDEIVVSLTESGANVNAVGPGGTTALSHNDDGHADFAGTGPGSASTTSRFRGSITHPVHPLSTLRTPRYHDARNTRSRSVRYDFDRTGPSPASHLQLAQRTPIRSWNLIQE